MKEVVLGFDESAYQTLNNLKRKLHIDSNAALIKRALAVLSVYEDLREEEGMNNHDAK